MQNFYNHLAWDLQESAEKAGQVDTLQALRAIVEDKLDGNS